MLGRHVAETSFKAHLPPAGNWQLATGNNVAVLRGGAICLCLLFVAAGCGGSSSASGTVANDFDGPAAYRWVQRIVSSGPRPAGSPTLYRVAARLKGALPEGRYERVPHGLRNVVGTVPGKDPGKYVVVGAHYETKDVPGFVGANDSASGTAVVLQLARTLRPRTIGPTVHFVLFDGEESPPGTPDSEFLAKGLRGSKAAGRDFRRAQAMILLDYVGNKGLKLPREGFSDQDLWGQLRAAAQRVGRGSYFPNSVEDSIYDDHWPFLQRGIPSIDLIDWSYRACVHKPCDDLSQISERSLDATGESVLELLRTL
jgi:glutaminyl-peptide cyclotransferase